MPAARLLDEVLAELASSGDNPKLLLHCCCAPCASYVLEYLSPFFTITAFFYNANVMPREEHDKREAELKKLFALACYPNCIDVETRSYSPGVFAEEFAPFWDEPEGGARCRKCFELRLKETAMLAM